jgi:hypothetical protein
MNSTKYSAPTNVYRENGMWVFDHFPQGVRTRYGEFRDEQAAIKQLEKLQTEWVASGRFVNWRPKV